MREKLAQLIQDYDVSDCVHLAGRMKHGEVMKKLDKAHLLIVPSIELKEDIDGIPTVIAESMLLHTPVLTTPVGGINELITHGSTGFMVAPDNAEQLAIAITRLHDAAIRNSVVAQAYTTGDELVVARCDLDWCSKYKETLFNFDKYRRPEVYGSITAQKGVIFED